MTNLDLPKDVTFVLWPFVFLIVGIALCAFIMNRSGNDPRERVLFDTAVSDAKRWTDHLGTQLSGLTGKDEASRQALADANERHDAAQNALAYAQAPDEVRAARNAALEGMHYLNAAREIMGMATESPLPKLRGQLEAGRVGEERMIRQEDGPTLLASPMPSVSTPHFYPGGAVAGRPVPAGWYSDPWRKPALVAGTWAAGAAALSSSVYAEAEEDPRKKMESASGSGGGSDDWSSTPSSGNATFDNESRGGWFGGFFDGDGGDGGGDGGGGD
ncbi:DUF1542 domain-containing protein [Corynebacterium gottingense]|uniref:DUF1542 domain-containing protein n=1 Tax=Corynebacterium gottingense TaxID=2041036 RepID=UPI0038CFF55A